MRTQELLRGELARRVSAAAAGLDGRRDVETGATSLLPGLDRPPDLDRLPDLAELAAAETCAPDMTAIAVLRSFDPWTFIRSSLDFALGLDPASADGWYRAFTRTVFLTGNPVNLAERFPFRQVTGDGSIAWYGPVPSAQAVALRRLLKLFSGTAEPTPPATMTVDVPGAHEGGRGTHGRRFELLVATAGLTMTDYLVHLNHTLAEAALTGTIRGGDRLLIRHVPRLAVTASPYSALRVHRDEHDRTRLRAYTCLRPESDTAPPARHEEA